MRRTAVWILILGGTVSFLSDASRLLAQSAAGATNAAIATAAEKVARDPANPELQYALAYFQHKAGRVNDAKKSVVAARGLEKKRPVADWGRVMERFQGPSRVWLDEARRAPIEDLLTYLYEAAWKALDARARQVMRALLLVTDEGGRMKIDRVQRQPALGRQPPRHRGVDPPRQQQQAAARAAHR